MRVLVAMSGGVDSSVAAALLIDQGHEVVGATMKLWGGVSDSGCCSVADVADARRVADRLGIDHHTFDFTEYFEAAVVDPYVSAHAEGRTPNPCAECNRHLKFRRFLDRARRLGFDAIATGHHAKVVRDAAGVPHLARGQDRKKDQSYVLAMLGAEQLERTLLPVGDYDKSEIRAIAQRLLLPTAAKADSQEVCFIARHGSAAGRQRFLEQRIALHPGRVLDQRSGEHLGDVAAVELVTIGQRRGLGLRGGLAGEDGAARRYALGVDVATRTVVVGEEAELATRFWPLSQWTSLDGSLPLGAVIEAQASAHGRPRRGVLEAGGVRLEEPARRVAPGQLVACYVGDEVVASGVVTAVPAGPRADA
ncbi:MAG: tRNA 2-thiouridine(34) synthase MnmA [Actinomycetota bacterium]|nr:tRNA 2-thiouridine(34) synthase MnmA [Actinomycetota bacterium]